MTTVAHALVRAVFALLRTQSCEKDRRSHKCERGTQECVRHNQAECERALMLYRAATVRESVILRPVR
jgi:hypothetical protein